MAFATVSCAGVSAMLRLSNTRLPVLRADDRQGGNALGAVLRCWLIMMAPNTLTMSPAYPECCYKIRQDMLCQADSNLRDSCCRKGQMPSGAFGKVDCNLSTAAYKLLRHLTGSPIPA